MDRRTCGVQRKISCVLKTIVREAPSTKRHGQNYIVEAADELSTEVLSSDLSNAIATEKFDGTCCYVREHNGKVMLWARLDRKPNKHAEKRFKIFQQKHRQWKSTQNGPEPSFDWKFPDDLKVVPEYWIPANGVDIDELSHCPIPDKNGHVPGWVPIDKKNPQYCWHSSVIDYDLDIALTLKPILLQHSDPTLEISPTSLAKLNGRTLELIGTNINGNPYCLGNKLNPFHILVEHGCVMTKGLSEISFESIMKWFQSSEYSRVEGVVWHLPQEKMFKLHRHHMKLPWPLPKDVPPLLSRTPVRISSHELQMADFPSKSMFNTIKSLDGRYYAEFNDMFNH